MALDVPGLGEAEELVRKLKPLVKTFKVGQELFTAEGPRAVQMVHAHECRVFLDLKFHDIPSTVSGGCASAARLGVFMLNVHALGGGRMMSEAVRAAYETAAEKKTRPPLLLAVTVLTSLAKRDLEEVGIKKKIEAEVKALALLSKKCGMNGVVASGDEISLIREAVRRPFLVVTPGVRPTWAARGDQNRVVTPKEALRRGADYIVVGRPITRDKDPRGAAERVLEEMRGALKRQ